MIVCEMYICISCADVCVPMSLFVHECVYVYVCVREIMCAYMSARVSVRVCIYMCKYVYVFVQFCVYVCQYVSVNVLLNYTCILPRMRA